ncbi:MAG: pentapeptide repeat-containing protein [Ktedonobacterales bacterium]
MSDESGHGKQQSEATTATTTGDKWGDPISPERQGELQGYLDRWDKETDHGERKGPFAGVKLSGADVYWAARRAKRYDFSEAHLEGAYLGRAHLNHAILRKTRLEGASLFQAHLEGANLHDAHLEGANLTGTWFDKTTHLNNASLTGVRLDQAIFDNTNLTVVDWSPVTMLGDEQAARARKDKAGKPKNRATRLNEYKSAVRANRVLAVTLRSQGMNEDADRFAYRAQFLQQQVLRRQRKFGGYIFSRLLDGLAGYGYKPVRGLIAYLVVIAGFAFAYGLATHGILTFGLPRSSIQPLQWYEALVLSISSFHGRGFFQPVQSLGDPVAIIAAAEAILGLLIEISFIATFTQRFFGR